MRYAINALILITIIFTFPIMVMAQDENVDPQALSQDEAAVAKDVDTAVPGDPVMENQAAQPEAEASGKIEIDDSTKLVLAIADLHVDKASESFRTNDMAKAERALRRASSVMTTGLTRAGEALSERVLTSANALTELADRVKAGTITSAKEFEESLDQNYRIVFETKPMASEVQS